MFTSLSKLKFLVMALFVFTFASCQKTEISTTELTEKSDGTQ